MAKIVEVEIECPRCDHIADEDMLDMEPGHRERASGMRADVYRAICRGDLDAAEDAMNLLFMVGIDRDEIERARKCRL